MRFALTLGAALALPPATRAQDPAYPRRLLFVQIADYPVLNPLTRAVPGGADRTRDAAARLAAGLRVPNARDNDQVFVVSDANWPTKDVLAKALDGFCATTRAQDRVALYFGTHAVELGGKAFVVPVDDDPLAPDSLLAVADVYAKLKELKAAQKVVIWDVCRLNPERVHGRRDPGPMTPALFKALAAAPEGVQVLVGCSPGQHALEYFVPRGPAGAVPGSAYLDALRQAAADERAAFPEAVPGEEIPVEALHRGALKAVAAVTKGQTPALAGKPLRTGPRYDPDEAPPRRFELPAPPKGLPTADVKAIFDELAMPPVVEGDAPPVRFPFPEAALKGHAADASADEIFKNADRYPLRIATLRAVQTVRNGWRVKGKEQAAVATLQAPINDPRKRAVTVAQEAVARTLIDLELELDRLTAVGNKRAAETRRWQANYDYAVAELRLRIVLLNEYNRALGHARTDALPDLPKGGTGWRLVPAAKVEGRKDTQAMLKAADDGFARLAEEHRGTPWEVMAKRSRATLPGARWEPFAAAAAGK
jgi:hypothetical protein